ncbi:MAG: glycosyltransferase [Rhodospirillales bacterium]|jgi:spore maturation protein CgeB|nr:glycosyltransferase [Rhodospirillales bacterium]
MSLSILILGLSVTSSWGNGHATTYRGLMRELVRRGHRVTFLERDMPWYADNRDLPKPPYGRTMLYSSVDELRRRWSATVTAADVIILGSFVPDGAEIARWLIARSRGLTAFYDIDTPVTMTRLEKGDADYISLDLVPQFDLYLSFTGGPTLSRLERDFGARVARPLYCSADTEIYKPLHHPLKWDLGYIGTYSADRQPTLEELLITPLRGLPKLKGVVAGPQYPDDLSWPRNVRRIEHLPPDRHRAFYAAQRFTLNVTRRDMVRAGFSPSIRLFEAAATGTPIISDWWQGLDQFFTPGEEILVAKSSKDVVRALRDMGEEQRKSIAERARARVLAGHTAAHRALELERYIREAAQHRRERRLQTRLAGAAATRPVVP